MSQTLAPRSGWRVALVAVAAVASVAWSVLADLRAATDRQWLIIAILAAVGLVGHLIHGRFGTLDSDSTPPWDVHTTWLLPAALLTPPVAFFPLVALSIALTSFRRQHDPAIRVVVGGITVMTSAAIHLCATVIDSVLWAGLAGTAAQWLIGIAVALVAMSLFLTPTGAAIWLDYRWSLVQMGCALSGLLAALAMVTTPWAGLLLVAPLLLAGFALHWPELDRHARMDSKTGLPNAKHWEDRSRDLVTAAAMQRVPVTVMILDLDHFKEVNDTYGHLVGDQVLATVAAVLRSQINPGDVPGRFGGEEFVITMFTLTAEQALAAANRIRRAIAAVQHHGGRRGPAGHGSTGTFHATCSIGVATSQTGGYDLGVLLAAADEALVAGKRAGRNRVEVAAGSGPDASVGPLFVATHKTRWFTVAGQQRRTRSGRR